jgi:hypothetical protein
MTIEEVGVEAVLHDRISGDIRPASISSRLVMTGIIGPATCTAGRDAQERDAA